MWGFLEYLLPPDGRVQCFTPLVKGGSLRPPDFDLELKSALTNFTFQDQLQRPAKPEKGEEMEHTLNLRPAASTHFSDASQGAQRVRCLFHIHRPAGLLCGISLLGTGTKRYNGKSPMQQR